MRYLLLVFITFLITLSSELLANDKKLNDIIDISVWGQIWVPYSVGSEFQLEEGGDLEEVDNRADLFMRRGRVYLKARPINVLQFNLQLYYDNLGKENLTSLRGDNNEAGFGIWDAFLSYSVHSDFLNITAGYFRPQIGREGITSASNVNSFEKSFTQNYLREHSVGRGNGRETGMNIGGLYLLNNFGLKYDMGVFDSNHEGITGTESGGEKQAYIFAGRLVFMIGDPEMENYGIGYQINYFRERRGISLALNGSYTGETNIFKENTFIGGDILFNWDGITFDSEYDVISRDIGGADYTDIVWHIRGGYTFPVSDYFIEPVIMYNRFDGDENSLRYPGGMDEIINMGVNFYIFRNDLKLSLHYIQSNGEAISKQTDGETFRFGDVFAFGCQFNF